MRRQWLTGLIREVHIASRGTYGSRRVHAELTLGMGVQVSERLVAVLMHDAAICGLVSALRPANWEIKNATAATASTAAIDKKILFRVFTLRWIVELNR